MSHPPPSAPSLPCPPPTPPVYLRFLRILPGVGLPVAFISPKWWATATHYNGRRTVHCPAGLRGPCVASCPPGRPRWTAYAVVYPSRQLGPRLLSWCAHSHYGSPDISMLAGDLAGQVFHVRRSTDQHNSPLEFIRTGQGDPRSLPRCEDVRVYLSRLWDVQL